MHSLDGMAICARPMAQARRLWERTARSTRQRQRLPLELRQACSPIARIAFTKLQKAIFGTRRVALESKKMAYESLVLSLLLYGSECWVVNAENMRLLQRFHRKCIRIMCRARVTRHHTRKHHISTEELEAKLGIHDIRHYVHSRVLRYLA